MKVFGRKTWYTSLIHKNFSITEFFEILRSSSTNFFSTVGESIIDGKLW